MCRSPFSRFNQRRNDQRLSRIRAVASDGRSGPLTRQHGKGPPVACRFCPTLPGVGTEVSRLRRIRRDNAAVTRRPCTLLPATSSGGENVPRPPLPGDSVTMPPPTPLFPGRPMSYSHSPDRSYSPHVIITASKPPAVVGGDHPSTVEWVDAAVGERGTPSPPGPVPSRQRTLARLDNISATDARRNARRRTARCRNSPAPRPFTRGTTSKINLAFRW